MSSRVWTFQQFRSGSGRDSITDWRKGLSPARRAALDVFLDRIAKMSSWPHGICDPLKGYKDCWELRWTAGKVEHRIFGFYSGRLLLSMLIGCTHKGRIYDPPGVFDTMVDRRRKLTTGEGTLSAYELVSVGGDEE